MLKRGRGEYLLHDVFEAIHDGKKDLWIGLRGEKTVACLIGEVVIYPRYSVYLIFGFVADDMKYWIAEHFYRLEEHARANSCAFLEEWGRDGWERALPDWQKTHVVMRKKL